jgi:type IV pilus assembly protein PilN
MRLDINLASHPYQDTEQFWKLWGTALGLAILLTLGLVGYTVNAWYHARQQQVAIAGLRKKITSLEATEAQARQFLDRPEHRTTRDRSQFLNDLFHRKAFSWTRVFEDLEQLMPGRLHVVSIHPELTADNQLKISLIVAGESRDKALELVRKMEDSQHFLRTEINSEQSHKDQSTSEVEFDISALYVPQAPGNEAGGSQ